MALSWLGGGRTTRTAEEPKPDPLSVVELIWKEGPVETIECQYTDVHNGVLHLVGTGRRIPIANLHEWVVTVIHPRRYRFPI